VTQTIYKLRAALRDAGQNWFLIQTDRRGGVRFALRRDAAAAATEPRDDGGARW
jgi:DNA-binding winged helix-turn-helix (wHTH) protein